MDLAPPKAQQAYIRPLTRFHVNFHVGERYHAAANRVQEDRPRGQRGKRNLSPIQPNTADMGVSLMSHYPSDFFTR